MAEATYYSQRFLQSVPPPTDSHISHEEPASQANFDVLVNVARTIDQSLGQRRIDDAIISYQRLRAYHPKDAEANEYFDVIDATFRQLAIAARTLGEEDGIKLVRSDWSLTQYYLAPLTDQERTDSLASRAGRVLGVFAEAIATRETPSTACEALNNVEKLRRHYGRDCATLGPMSFGLRLCLEAGLKSLYLVVNEMALTTLRHVDIQQALCPDDVRGVHKAAVALGVAGYDIWKTEPIDSLRRPALGRLITGIREFVRSYRESLGKEEMSR